MALNTLVCLFTVGVIAHNTEEAFFLPAWSSNAGPWHAPVGTCEFIFAVAVLSLLLVALAALAMVSEPASVWAYLFTGYVFAMVANVFIPHVVGSLALRHYIPGTATALLLNLPFGSLFLQRALAEGFVEWGTIAWVAPVTAVAIVASIPILFALGRSLPFGSRKAKRDAT